VFHVISAALARLARRIDAIRDGRICEAASWYGWTAVQVSRTTWEYRDPRFTALRMDRLGLRTGCDHCDEKIETVIDNRVAECIAAPIGGSWSRAAIADRIGRLGDVPVWTRDPGTGVFLASGQTLTGTEGTTSGRP
jgi:hypothetical protein